jgi:prevent-host-death family protein
MRGPTARTKNKTRNEVNPGPATTISIVDARSEFSNLVNRAAFGKERIVLSRHGRALVAIVPVEDVELIERLQDQIDIGDALQARNEAERVGAKSLSQLKKELKLNSNVQNRSRSRGGAGA